MGLITFNQTDTSDTFAVGCSGQSAGVTTDARQAIDGGTLGSGASGFTIDPDNNVTRACFAWVCGKPGVASWATGDWVIRLDFASGDAGTTVSELHVCDNNAGTIIDVDTDTSATGLSLSTTTMPGPGYHEVTINQGGAHTPQSTADSQPMIIVVLTNSDPHGATSVDLSSNQTIASPIDNGVGSAPIPCSSFQYRQRRVGI